MYLNYKSIIEELSLLWIIVDLNIKLKAQYVTWTMHFFITVANEEEMEVEMSMELREIALMMTFSKIW